MVDDKLNWGGQFRSVKGKIASGLVSSLVESHLRYANVVWGGLSDTKMEALQRLQNRAFDITDSSRLKSLWERRSLNVNQVMNFDRSLMTYKIMNNLCPEILQNKFQERSSISKYNTRNKRDLHFQRPNLECAKKSFFYTGARAWNSIPQSIKDARSVATLKKKTENSIFELKDKITLTHGFMEEQYLGLAKLDSYCRNKFLYVGLLLLLYMFLLTE